MHSQSAVSDFCDPMDCSPPGSSGHGILQAKTTGVGCHALLQGIFSTPGLDPRIRPTCLGRWILPLSHLGSPGQENSVYQSGQWACSGLSLQSFDEEAALGVWGVGLKPEGTEPQGITGKLATGFGGSQTSEFRIVDTGDFHPLLGPLPHLI